jgi:thiosulfate reductase cytochrome b subunit
MTKRIVKVYPRYERFWHWSQMLLIMSLLFTGFGLNGVHSLVTFELAVQLHVFAALALVLLWIFTIFWMFTTGTWRQFIPRLSGVMHIARYYLWGVFQGEAHPYRKILWRKHNPLQAVTYLGLKLLIFPTLWITGLLYLSYNYWAEGVAGSEALALIAGLHVFAAYVIVIFILVHLYLLTVGHGFISHIKPMVTGYDEIELTTEQEAYLKQNEPGRLA